MAALNLENLPDTLYHQIQELAIAHNCSINHQVIALLQQAVATSQPRITFTISPETDPTWAERCQAVPKLLAEIKQRRGQRVTNIEWIDSTALLREDRNR